MTIPNQEDETHKKVISEMKSMKQEMAGKSNDKKAEESDSGDKENAEEAPATEVSGGGEEAEANQEEGKQAKAKETEEEELIRIGDKEFKTQAEALAYAESLQLEKLAGDNYSKGIQDAIQAIKGQEPAAPVEEDNFEEKFYSNPKATLQEVKEQAKRELKEELTKEARRENLWNQFLTENPDLRRKDAQRVLEENWETLGKITDLSKAMKILATKTRAEYQEIAERLRPRTELPNKSGQAVSSGSGAPASVTHTKKESSSPNFIAEMKKIRRT